MSRPTPVFIVCSPRPRIGKTLTARLVAEFYRSEARPVAAFDVSPYEPGIAEFLPSYTTRASIADIRGQMALFDRLIVNDDRPKVIDLSHYLFTDFFAVVREIGFIVDAPSCGIAPTILYAVDGAQETQAAYATLLKMFPEADILPVRNDAFAQRVDVRMLYPLRNAGLPPLHIPRLSHPAQAMVDHRAFSFMEFRRQPPPLLPAALRDELESWLKRVFLQMRERELRSLMGSVQDSLARGAREAEPLGGALWP